MTTPAASSFSLIPFQEQAASALRSAALSWVSKAVERGSAPRYGTADIPFVGQLRAVTGAGKTPILADVVSGLGSGVVLWTTRSSPVVEQTYNNLLTRYRTLLPSKELKVLRQIPGQQEWRDLIERGDGLTIWVLTTGSWNEVESAKAAGSQDARLNLHRPQADWAGGSTSPWEQLRSELRRPLWVVSDESHNQTPSQLEQLADLRPVGFFMASATPVHNELFDAWTKTLEREPEWRQLAEAGSVSVRTRDVVAAELLKTTLELIDYNSGTEESLDGALAALERVDRAAATEGVGLRPKAIYVVEKSNRPKGSMDEPRPVAIWRHLVSRGVEPHEIAIFTDTKLDDLPAGAERVSGLANLQPRHRHIIFNQTLQEGWDDPEAYVCYFDGVTKSFVRIRQIVGRVLRQPQVCRFRSEELNSAVLIVNTPADSYEQVLREIRAELRLYAPDDTSIDSIIRVKTRRDPLPAVAPDPKYADVRLPRWNLAAPDMTSVTRALRTTALRPWPKEALDAPGIGRRATISLASEKNARTDYINVIRSARTVNGPYFRRQLSAMNRNALNAVHSDLYMHGAAFTQESCQGSLAQDDLRNLAIEAASTYEDAVTYDEDPDPELAEWAIGDHRPKNSDFVKFRRAVHPHYSRGNFNGDEYHFAEALDNYGGDSTWMRNGDSGSVSYAIPLPAKSGGSLRFFPDFLWWPGGPSGACLAIDTTGSHLVQEKIRGKLLGISKPRIALVVRGFVDLAHEKVVPGSSWSFMIARPFLKPMTGTAEDLQSLLRNIDPGTDDR